MGRVNVEGDAVEQLFLGAVATEGMIDLQKPIAMRRPNLQMAIPAGDYAVLRIDLKGGFIHIAPLLVADRKARLPPKGERLTVVPNKPCTVTVGLPLRPALLAGRRGRTIQFLYGLYDRQSRYYLEKRQKQPPQFTVSCDGREIGSGALQYVRGATYGGSWRVPSTVFHGPLSIVASAELGEMGRGQTRPILVDWQWYDQLAPYAGWVLLGVLLLVVKENRNRQALLVLIPFLLLSEIIWPWLVYFLASLSVDTAQFGEPFQWLLVAWTALWLLSPWLLRLPPAAAIVAALLVAAMVGGAAEFGLAGSLVFTSALMNYSILLVALLLAFVLSGVCCRRNYSPRRFLLWFAPWLVAGVVLGAIAELVRLYAVVAKGAVAPPVGQLLPGLAISSSCFAALLYLVNLPYQYLAFNSDLYRERFHLILRLPAHVPPAEAPPENEGESETAAQTPAP